MNFGRSKRTARTLLVELTPMIDVVFLLIIFFMAAARFAQETRAEVELPQERGEQHEAEEAGLIVNLTSGGVLIVDGETIELEDLEQMINARVQRLPGRDPEQMKLTIRADRSANTAHLNRLIRILEEAGLGTASFATGVP